MGGHQTAAPTEAPFVGRFPVHLVTLDFFELPMHSSISERLVGALPAELGASHRFLHFFRGRFQKSWTRRGVGQP